jgi:hypothetical protein
MAANLAKKLKTDKIDSFGCFECKEADDIYGEDQAVPCCGQLLCSRCINKLKQGKYKCTLCDKDTLMVKGERLLVFSERFLVNNATVTGVCILQ